MCLINFSNLIAMNTEIFSSPFVMKKLSDAYSALNASEPSGYSFHRMTDFSLPQQNNAMDEVRIQVVDLWDTTRFYEELNKLGEPLAIAIIDNGSSCNLNQLLENKTLITRGLGIQSHCYTGDLSALQNERIIRLKDVKLKSDLCEIVLRTSDVAVFNMNAIRRGDQVGNTQSNTTGLGIEEACLMAKYIGASDLINDIYFVGVDLNNDDYDMMRHNLTNMFWYLNEGLRLRNIDNCYDHTDNLVFSVVPENMDYELEFIKSTHSGRWWVKVPLEEGQMHMACTKEDYDLACQNQITERISKALKGF